jgi:hypothetical protein
MFRSIFAPVSLDPCRLSLSYSSILLDHRHQKAPQRLFLFQKASSSLSSAKSLNFSEHLTRSEKIPEGVQVLVLGGVFW